MIRSAIVPVMFTILFFISACADKVGPHTVSEPQNNEWQLVWADEFDGVELDRSKWKPEISCWGGGNDEHQCYTDRAQNVYISNGSLRLKAFKESFAGRAFPEGHPDFPGNETTQPYTSGKVRTRGLADWTYGRFEARIKLPQGQGTWPAFWMMSADDSYGRWPLSGEIDILEAVNLGATCPECEGDEGENRTIAALHFGSVWPDNTYLTIKNRLPGGQGAKDDYHVFGVEWGEGLINWFVDEEKIFSLEQDQWFTDAVSKDDNPTAPFDQPFYLMFNLAVGGGLSERGNEKKFDPETFPTELLVDWVRVYQCAQDEATGRACMNDN